ncbi:MAG: CpaF family protein [archaeon]|nr:CpaF family protein [archaeon]
MADYLDQLIKKAKDAKKEEKPSVQELKSKLLEKKMDKDVGKPSSKEAAARAEKKIEKASGQPEIQLSKSTQVGAKQEEERKEEAERKSAVELDLEAQKKIELASYGDVKVYKVEGKPLLYYYTPVIKPSGGEKNVINTIKEAATRIISIAPYKIRDPEQRRNAYKQRILEILTASKELNIPERRFEFYAEAVVREMVGYGIIDSLIRDDKLEEIMVIGAKKPVYVFHREYEMMATNIEFFNESEIIDLINRIGREIGRRIDISSPLLDARLPDGSRVNATIPPASPSGASLTIRKFREDPYSIVDLINFGTIDVNAAAFLWLCVEGMGTKPASILISGGTGSGKTTFLNVMASFISPTERIIVIEDTSELNLPLTHLISMEARPPGLEGTGELTMDILTKNALRMRPDRIIVGEVRHAEAFTLFTALNTGHSGSLGTIHANSPAETIVRVTSPPMSVPEVMLSGLDFIVIEHRIHDKKKGTIRRVTEIAEVSGTLEGKTTTNDLFEWDALSDKLVMNQGYQSRYIKELQKFTGLTKKQLDDEIAERAELLRMLVKKGIRSLPQVSQIIQQYITEKRGQ